MLDRIGRWRFAWLLGWISGAGSTWLFLHRAQFWVGFAALAILAAGVLALGAQRIVEGGRRQ